MGKTVTGLRVEGVSPKQNQSLQIQTAEKEQVVITRLIILKTAFGLPEKSRALLSPPPSMAAVAFTIIPKPKNCPLKELGHLSL